MIIAIAAVGARDLRCPTGPGEWCSLDSRADAQNLKDIARRLGCAPSLRAVTRHYVQSQLPLDDWRIPILEPALEFILAAKQKVDRLLFVATDQPDADDRFQADDTVDAAQLVADCVKRRFADRVAAVVPNFLVIARPSDRNDVASRLRAALTNAIPLDGHHTVYVLSKGGMPQVKDALRLAAFSLYGPALKVIEVAEPSSDHSGADAGRAYETGIGALARDAVRHSAIALVRAGHYAGARATLESFEASSWPIETLELLDLGSAHVNLDFESAALGHYDGSSEKWRIFGERPAHDALQRVAYVYFLIRLAIQQGRYADALFRLALLRESCKWQLTLIALGHAFAQYGLTDLLPIALLVHEHPRLAQSLQAHKSKPPETMTLGGADFWRICESRHKRTVENYAREIVGRRSETGQVFAVLDRQAFHNLRDLRNGLIHFPNGLTLRMLAAAVGNVPLRRIEDGAAEQLAVLEKWLDELRTILARLFSLQDRTMPDDPFPQLSRVIERQLLEAQ